jgi:hypothetical protein
VIQHQETSLAARQHTPGLLIQEIDELLGLLGRHLLLPVHSSRMLPAPMLLLASSSRPGCLSIS